MTDSKTAPFEQDVNTIHQQILFSQLHHLRKECRKENKKFKGDCSLYEKKNKIKQFQIIRFKLKGSAVFKNIRMGAAKAAKKIAIKETNNSIRALDFAADLSTATTTWNPNVKATSAPSVVKSIHQGSEASTWEEYKRHDFSWNYSRKTLLQIFITKDIFFDTNSLKNLRTIK